MSHEVCQSITRKSASNLALAFILLPVERRMAMATLYAFCREVDDVADEDALPVEERRRQLNQWREDVRSACAAGQAQLPVNRELAPVIRRYGLPFDYFDEVIRGVEMDLEQNRYETWDQLETYCYRVASMVGLLSIEIFGYRNSGCRDYAIALGKALQLTNILRDVRNDAQRGRVYLPREALEEHGVTAEQILKGVYSDRFRALAQATADRARGYFQSARTLLPPEDRRTMISAELMGAVYWRLLRQLEKEDFRVFKDGLTRVSTPTKLYLIFRAWVRSLLGSTKPNYAG